MRDHCSRTQISLFDSSEPNTSRLAQTYALSSFVESLGFFRDNRWGNRPGASSEESLMVEEKALEDLCAPEQLTRRCVRQQSSWRPHSAGLMVEGRQKEA
jgi:hypothetical protein